MSTNVAPDFVAYPKTPRLFREIVVTEKLDGTNSQIVIEEAPDALLTGEALENYLTLGCDETHVRRYLVRAGSRNRWINPKDDNYGFAKWVAENRDELVKLGPGRHFGEWWGGGIQRGYGLAGNDKRFSLFNVARWADGAVTADGPRPACCGVVPVLHRGEFDTRQIKAICEVLAVEGSAAVPGFMKPEGIIVFHTAANKAFKVLLENDGEAKGE